MRNDEEERFNELEEEQHEAEAETSAELAAEDPAVLSGSIANAAPRAAGEEGPYVSEDGAVMGRDFVIPGVDPREHAPYRFHTGRKRDHGGTDAIEVIDLV